MKSIIELAKQAGFQERNGIVRTMHSSGAWVAINDELEDFAALVRAAALEEAWNAVNKTPGQQVRCDCMNGWGTVKDCADAILQLKETK